MSWPLKFQGDTWEKSIYKPWWKLQNDLQLSENMMHSKRESLPAKWNIKQTNSDKANKGTGGRNSPSILARAISLKKVIPQRTRKRNITKLKWFYTVKTCMGRWNPREPNYWSPTLNRYHPAKIWGTKAPVHVWTIHDQLEWECERVRLSPHITKSSFYIHT